MELAEKIEEMSIHGSQIEECEQGLLIAENQISALKSSKDKTKDTLEMPDLIFAIEKDDDL